MQDRLHPCEHGNNINSSMIRVFSITKDGNRADFTLSCFVLQIYPQYHSNRGDDVLVDFFDHRHRSRASMSCPPPHTLKN